MGNNRVLYLIVRIGGWDGISLQSRLWIKLLLSLGKKITLVTGELDESPGSMNSFPYNRIRKVLISEMSLRSQSGLYENAFRGKYKREPWLREFVEKKERIKEPLRELVGKSDIVLSHNLSIKHLVPSAWAAFYELASEFKEKRFVSIDADSPYERGFVISDMHPEALWIMGDPGIWEAQSVEDISGNLTKLGGKVPQVLPGPEPLPNIRRISFNNYQSRVVREIYGVSPENVITIPDMGEFARCSDLRKVSTGGLLRLIGSGQVINSRESATRKDVFIISPLRPVYRKNMKYIAYLANQFRSYIEEKGNGRNVFLVVTHALESGTGDSYWEDLKKIVSRMDITLVHLGDKLKLRGRGLLYQEFLWAMSKMNSISVIGSSSGAWENGIVESTEFRIPVSVNPLLPAYHDMVLMGFRYVPCPVTEAAVMMEKDCEKAWLHDPSIERFFESIGEMIFDRRIREEVVEHNFRVGKGRMSLEAVRPLVEEILK